MKYTAMYGHESGFYHDFEATDEKDAVNQAFAYMKTEEFSEREKNMNVGTLEIYQIMEGAWDDNGSRYIVWDYFNGYLA